MAGVRLALGVLGLLCASGCAEPAAVDPSAVGQRAPSTAPRALDSPAGPGAMAPDLVNAGSEAFLSWLEPAEENDGTTGGHALFTSRLADAGWEPARRIVAGGDFFANWADLPMTSRAADGTRFAHWLRKLGSDTYAYGVALARSRDDGETWEEIGWLHDDTSPTEHGFVAYVPLAERGVQAFWLDGRAMAEGGAMQLRTTVLGADGPTDPGEVLDDRVCECCATDAALTPSGPIVAYRDRSDGEVRDIAVVRATEEGWSEPTLIHDDGWQIHGCPVNGPAIAADGSLVAVAWFSAAEENPIVKLAFSRDAGATFGRAIVVDAATPLGRVDVVLHPEGSALVSWLRGTEDGAEIRWRSIAPNGRQGASQLVAATTAARSAGVPRMVRHGERLIFAWVEDAEPSRLSTGVVTLR